MAQRLATEYVKTCLVLAETELSQLLHLFQSNNLPFKVKVLDNGDQEIFFEDASGTGIVLMFARKLGKYVLEGSCRFTDLRMANAMRKAILQFKGDAVAHRIYEYYTLEYVYRSGAVVKITEHSANGERLIFELKDTIGELAERFYDNWVEGQIQWVRVEINEWLDRRNNCSDDEQRLRIDERLKELAHVLFVLEA
jgi:hypothetical protein